MPPKADIHTLDGDEQKSSGRTLMEALACVICERPTGRMWRLQVLYTRRDHGTVHRRHGTALMQLIVGLTISIIVS